MSLCGNNNPCPDLVTGKQCGITYTGARYVPLFADPAQWDNTKAYEPLTIVLNEGNSYTSKTFVPVGVDIGNEQYWALTGNYNAQVEAYRQEVKKVEKQLEYIYDTYILIDQYMEENNINDYTLALNTIIQNNTTSTYVKFPLAKSIQLGKINEINNSITIDFNQCLITPITNDNVFTLKLTQNTPNPIYTRTQIINFNFYNTSSFTPQSIFYINGEINTIIKGKFQLISCQHSVINCNMDYGQLIDCEFRNCTAPRMIYLAENLTAGNLRNSVASQLNVDISSCTGTGVETEGGYHNITGVIEGCDIGYKYNGSSTMFIANVNVWMEGNRTLDYQLLNGFGQFNISGYVNNTKENPIQIGGGLTIRFSNFYYGRLSTTNLIKFIENSTGTVVYWVSLAGVKYDLNGTSNTFYRRNQFFDTGVLTANDVTSNTNLYINGSILSSTAGDNWGLQRAIFGLNPITGKAFWLGDDAHMVTRINVNEIRMKKPDGTIMSGKLNADGVLTFT